MDKNITAIVYMKLYDINGKEFELPEVVSIDCNIAHRSSLTDERLKNLKFVICNFLSSEGGWSISVTCQKDQNTVNTFDNDSTTFVVGAAYYSNEGTITNSLVRNPLGYNFTITNIIGFK